MKQQLKAVLKKVPVLKKYYQKYTNIRDEKEALDTLLHTIAHDNVGLRLQMKKIKGEPIHVVFLCHRPAVWESLHSVYDALKQDPAFQVTLVAIPNKKQLPKLGLSHEEYESEGAEEFWKNEGCIHGYNYETGEWLDLEALKPDYVFFQTPYNICRPPQYHSSVISLYAKICYVCYFGCYHTNKVYDECTPLDYLKDVSLFFAQNPADEEYIQNRALLAGAKHCTIINTGFPRYDRIDTYRTQPCSIWRDPDSYKIVWTPRWTTNEGNCHFFDYKDKIVEYCKRTPGLELVFRPHPQAFKEWNATGELPEAEALQYKQNYTAGNLHLDESSNYCAMIYASDCLITDTSSMILDYLCTGKPIIYCTRNLEGDSLFPFLMKSMYCVSAWEDVEKILEDLRQGIDPLKEYRQQAVSANLIQPGGPVGQKIADILKL